MRKHGGFSYRKLSCGMQAQSDAAHALGTCLSLLMQSSQIIENNSHVTPVRIIRKDGEFYTIQFADQGRISLRGSRLYHTEEEAQKKIEEKYLDEAGWAKSAILNVSCSGKFTSDRTIQEYVDEIWHLDKVVLK